MSNTNVGSADTSREKLYDDMIDVMVAVAKHFEGTDAPLGSAARSVLVRLRDLERVLSSDECLGEDREPSKQVDEDGITLPQYQE